MRFTIFGIILAALLASAPAWADGVFVEPYTRDDGTYVEPHYRSAPDSSRSNNFGPSQSDRDRYNPSLRDYDDDGISNQYDFDSDDDRHPDTLDTNPYSPNTY